MITRKTVEKVSQRAARDLKQVVAYQKCEIASADSAMKGAEETYRRVLEREQKRKDAATKELSNAEAHLEMLEAIDVSAV